MENQIITPKKTIFSGIQPSGTLTLGNYIGALRNFNRFPEDEWFAPNTIGFNPYLTRSYIGADGKRVVIPPCPIKVWQGTADTTVDPVMVTEFVESVRRSGSYIEFHLMEGVGHKLNDVMRTELAMWFDRFI